MLESGFGAVLTPDALVVVCDEPVAFVVVEFDGIELEAPFEWVDVPEVSLPASEACVDGLASWPHADVAHAAHISHVGRRNCEGASWTGVKRSGRIGGWRVGSSGGGSSDEWTPWNRTARLYAGKNRLDHGD